MPGLIKLAVKLLPTGVVMFRSGEVQVKVPLPPDGVKTTDWPAFTGPVGPLHIVAPAFAATTLTLQGTVMPPEVTLKVLAPAFGKLALKAVEVVVVAVMPPPLKA
jgi:hypothetical protein